MPKYDSIFHKNSTVTEYRALRCIPSGVLNACSKLVLALCTHVKATGVRRVADAGAGTGRFLLPLADACANAGGAFELLAVDSSQIMLDELVARSGLYECEDRIAVFPICADLRDPLPVKPRSVHVVFTVATFHILDRWREAARNIIATLVPDGSFVVFQENNQFMHQTEGFSRNGDLPYLDQVLTEFMEQYHCLRREHGCPYEPSEVRYSDMTPLLKHLQQTGMRRRPIELNSDSLKWQKLHTYRDILTCFRQRNMTTWGSELSEDMRQRIADALDEWVTRRGIDVCDEFFLPAELIPHVFQRCEGRHEME